MGRNSCMMLMMPRATLCSMHYWIFQNEFDEVLCFSAENESQSNETAISQGNKIQKNGC